MCGKVCKYGSITSITSVHTIRANFVIDISTGRVNTPEAGHSRSLIFDYAQATRNAAFLLSFLRGTAQLEMTQPTTTNKIKQVCSAAQPA